MTLLEVAKHALEAMEDAMYRADTHEFYDAKESLRYAIEQAEQAEQEPVAWMHNHIERNVIAHKPADIDRHPGRWTALYSTPQPCPTCEALARTVMMDQTSHDTAPTPRKPLTDEEIINIGKEACAVEGPHILPVSFARAIERAHGIQGKE